MNVSDTNRAFVDFGSGGAFGLLVGFHAQEGLFAHPERLAFINDYLGVRMIAQPFRAYRPRACNLPTF